jgi:hypothetical protein
MGDLSQDLDLELPYMSQKMYRLSHSDRLSKVYTDSRYLVGKRSRFFFSFLGWSEAESTWCVTTVLLIVPTLDV